jgi:hypothetical protein
MGFVLGIAGPSNSGKDTIADYLIAQHGWSGKLSFARNLKDMCKFVFGLTEYQVNDQEGKKSPFRRSPAFTKELIDSTLEWISRTHQITAASRTRVGELEGMLFDNPRHILQIVGTEVCREISPTYHVDIIKNKVVEDGLWAITDVRFVNEAEFVKSIGGLVVKIIRHNLPDAHINRTHTSETALLSWPGFVGQIDNVEEGLENLYREVDNFLEKNNLCLLNTLSGNVAESNISPLTVVEILKGL